MKEKELERLTNLKKEEEAFTAHETAELGVMCLAVGKEKLI